MPQEKEKQPIADQSAPEPTDPEVRATIKATQKVLEESAAEIERSKRLLRATETLGSAEKTSTPPSSSEDAA